MNNNTKIAEWAGWKAPVGVLAGEWKHTWTTPRDSNELATWVHKSGAKMGGHEYLRRTKWEKPFTGTLYKDVPQFDDDITLWHATLFPLIEERRLKVNFVMALDEILPASTRREGGWIWGWELCKATPVQLAEALVRTIEEE